MNMHKPIDADSRNAVSSPLLRGRKRHAAIAAIALVVLGGIGECPECGARLEIVPANYFKPEDEWPLRDSCGSCRAEVKVEKT